MDIAGHGRICEALRTLSQTHELEVLPVPGPDQNVAYLRIESAERLSPTLAMNALHVAGLCRQNVFMSPQLPNLKLETVIESNEAPRTQIHLRDVSVPDKPLPPIRSNVAQEAPPSAL